MNRLEPITPGELLLEEFLTPMGITRYRLAKEIDVPAQRISEIVAGRRAITADTDLRLCRFFGLSSGYWLRAQVAHDTEVAERELEPVLRKIRPWTSTAARQENAAVAAARAAADRGRCTRGTNSRALTRVCAGAVPQAADSVPCPERVSAFPSSTRGKALDRPLAIGACLPFQAPGEDPERTPSPTARPGSIFPMTAPPANPYPLLG